MLQLATYNTQAVAPARRTWTMTTFGELLGTYMARTGISDSELARTLGVSRQTVFRWKEGQVARPRHRGEVLACAGRLRLSPGERDALLLAAGFPPVDVVAPPEVDAPVPATPGAPVPAPADAPVPATAGMSVPAPAGVPVPATAGVSVPAPGGAPVPAPGGAPVPASENPAPSIRRDRRRSAIRVGAVAVAATLALGGAWLVRQPHRRAATTARAGEALILVAPFAGELTPESTGTGGAGAARQGTADRLQAALERETRGLRLTAVRVARWPDVITSGQSVTTTLRRTGAAVLVWGETSGDRRIARVSVAHGAAGVVTTALALTGSEPAEERAVMLMALAGLTAAQGDRASARALLVQALSRPLADASARATLEAMLADLRQGAIGTP